MSTTGIGTPPGLLTLFFDDTRLDALKSPHLVSLCVKPPGGMADGMSSDRTEAARETGCVPRVCQ